MMASKALRRAVGGMEVGRSHLPSSTEFKRTAPLIGSPDKRPLGHTLVRATKGCALYRFGHGRALCGQARRAADEGRFAGQARGCRCRERLAADAQLRRLAAELELEPRRANLLGAFDDAADGPADEADGQGEPTDAADSAAA